MWTIRSAASTLANGPPRLKMTTEVGCHQLPFIIIIIILPLVLRSQGSLKLTIIIIIIITIIITIIFLTKRKKNVESHNTQRMCWINIKT